MNKKFIVSQWRNIDNWDWQRRTLKEGKRGRERERKRSNESQDSDLNWINSDAICWECRNIKF